jgi:hypothetical protein
MIDDEGTALFPVRDLRLRSHGIDERAVALGSRVIDGWAGLERDDVVLLELQVALQLPEVDGIEPDPPARLAVDPDAGDADGLSVGLGGIGCRLDGDQHPHLLGQPARWLGERLAGICLEK